MAGQRRGGGARDLDLDEVKRTKAVAENPGIVTYTNYEDVLNDPDVNCVVIVTPHNGATTPATAQRSVDIFIDNLQRYIAGQPLRNIVDKSAGY